MSSTVVAEAGTSPNTDKQRNASFEARFFFASKGWCFPECMEITPPLARASRTCVNRVPCRGSLLFWNLVGGLRRYGIVIKSVA